MVDPDLSIHGKCYFQANGGMVRRPRNATNSSQLKRHVLPQRVIRKAASPLRVRHQVGLVESAWVGGIRIMRDVITAARHTLGVHHRSAVGTRPSIGLGTSPF